MTKPTRRKPVFGEYLRDQQDRDDAVGVLARRVQASSFTGSSIGDVWDHLDQLDVMDDFGEAMQAAEYEHNALVLEWEEGMRGRYRIRSIVRGGLPGLGRR